MNDWNGLITAISSLLWPIIILIALIRFGAVLSRRLADSDVLTLKGAGFEASIERKRVEAAAALGAAEASREPANDSGSTDPIRIAQAVAKAIPNADADERLRQASILWVDDYPENNRYERAALNALGLNVEAATSTDEALLLLRRRTFDLVISDMDRPPDAFAGYTLLDALRSSGNSIPYLLYSSSRDPEQIQEAHRRGALGSTNSPEELITLAARALRG